VPVSGLKFTDCWTGNTYQSGTSVYQGWRLTLVDQVSEVVIGYFKPLNRGYYLVAHPDTIVDMFRSSAVIGASPGSIVDVGSVISQGNDRYFTFRRSDRPGKRCQGFVRYGPLQNAGSSYRVVGYFCRMATQDVKVDEVKFMTDGLQFK